MLKKELYTILSTIVGFKTVHGSANETRQLFEWIKEKYLLDKRIFVSDFNFSDMQSLVITTRQTKHPKILLQAHLDVVPASDQMFKVKETGEKLCGRGVFDMKFAAACYLNLLEDLNKELSNYDFGIMFTSDEEVGGENGVASLLESGYRADICLLPDGGDNWQVEESCNSVWIIKMTADGDNAHGSRPWEGENAITKLIDCIEKIKLDFTNKMYDNTLTVSQIQGGCALNQVPDQAWATLDMRFKDELNYSKLRTKIEKLIINDGLHIETIAHVGATKLNRSNPLVDSFIKLAQEKAPVEIGYNHSLGSSDAHYFESKGIPTILIRPRGGGAHSNNEWLQKDDLEIFYNLIKDYVIKFAQAT